ncbi:DNA gyrase subunit A [Desulfoluna limicola]|uniref:DNA gyrase subunit A n=1 Tax=Desulfoluna limicola TaxID=2810562 RepID=A0ABM7PH08_9BACT|nr:DNA gyrase subunit A [Desulfoluna limicola]BCS96832.1 DNA gyrase subunit A [Desulfoluna limicola]
MTQLESSPHISLETEMKKSYLEYAMSVIIGRALPDVRDGLKPVHRRSLFAMRELKNDWNKPYKKSARIVGDVIGKYHPHGDTAVYDTIVRMAQDFSLRYTLVDGQGNFGSIDGDSAAAMRYTEVRMRRIAHELLADLDKETVDWVANYDESLHEPSVLPAKFPNLLVNGSSGIAVGMTTNIPPHNLGEVIDGVCALIDNPELTSEDLMEHIPGPDFPTQGIIYGRKGIREAYTGGKGIIKVRAKVEIEKDKKDNSETIVVTELPYQVNKARLVEKIAELVKAKVIEGIRYVRDESDRKGMRIALGVKRDHMGEVVINQLFKHTQMQSSFGIIMLAVVNNRPELLTLRELLDHFILHRKEVVVRRTMYDLRKAEARAHILEGLKIALDNLDEVVALIRKSKNPVEAKDGLKARFGLSDIQAQAILDMRLQRLTGLEQEKIIEEYEGVMKDIAWFKEILGSQRIVLNIIKDELTTIREEFVDVRRTKIVEATGDISIEDLIEEEDMVVTVSTRGYIKRTPISVYESQRRGGKGRMAMSTRDDDFVEKLFVASTHHMFLFFTNLGRVYWSKVYELPQASRTSKGRAIVNFLNFAEGEKLTTVLAVPEFKEDHFVVVATRNGTVKKTDLMAYSRPRQGGIIAVGLADGDELVSARLSDGNMDVLMATREGKAVRFKEADVRGSGRSAKGVRGVRLSETDSLVSMEVLNAGEKVLMVTENGYGKRTPVEEYPLRGRGGKGVISIKTSERNGNVASLLLVDDEDDVMMMTNSGKLIRIRVQDVSVVGRNTQGVKLFGLDDKEHVAGAVRLPWQEEDEEEDAALEGAGGDAPETEPGDGESVEATPTEDGGPEADPGETPEATDDE